MTCDERDRQLSDFVDGGLPATAAAEFAAHLETCARCAGLARDLARLRDAARTLGPIDPRPACGARSPGGSHAPRRTPCRHQHGAARRRGGLPAWQRRSC